MYLNVSVFAHAELDDVIVEVILLGQLEQVLPRLLPQAQVHRVGVKPHLHYISLLLWFYITREYRTEKRRFAIRTIIRKEIILVTLQLSTD